MVDIGLFNAKSGLDISAMINPSDELLGIFNGAMTEQFVIQWQNELVPVEVKSGIRKKSKSLDVYRQLYNPKHAIRTTLRGGRWFFGAALYDGEFW